jgi:hypothetical protein
LCVSYLPVLKKRELGEKAISRRAEAVLAKQQNCLAEIL